MDPITLNIQLTPADCRALAVQTMKPRSWGMRGVIVWMLAIVLIAGAYFLKGPTDSVPEETVSAAKLSWTGYALEFFPLALVPVVAVFFFLRALGDKGMHDANEPGLFSPMVLRMSEEGVYTENAAGYGFHKWIAIRSLIDTGERYFLMVGKARAYIVPKRCFATSEAVARFGEEARAYIARTEPARLGCA